MRELPYSSMDLMDLYAQALSKQYKKSFRISIWLRRVYFTIFCSLVVFQKKWLNLLVGEGFLVSSRLRIWLLVIGYVVLIAYIGYLRERIAYKEYAIHNSSRLVSSIIVEDKFFTFLDKCMNYEKICEFASDVKNSSNKALVQDLCLYNSERIEWYYNYLSSNCEKYYKLLSKYLEEYTD